MDAAPGRRCSWALVTAGWLAGLATSAPCPASGGLVAIPPGTASALPDDKDKLVAAWRYKRDSVLVECAQRHYDLAR